jgi:hypothetical protein
MKHTRGQALVVLLVFILVGLTITTAAVVMVIVNSRAATTFSQGVVAQAIAESGAENALLRIIRDPAYAGETLTIGDGSATVEVTGTQDKIVTSRASLGNFIRTTIVGAHLENEVLTVTSWEQE